MIIIKNNNIYNTKNNIFNINTFYCSKNNDIHNKNNTFLIPRIFITQIILFFIPRIFRTQIIIFFYIKTLNYYKNNNLTTQIIIFFILILRIVEIF